jgi:hypothetical protein
LPDEDRYHISSPAFIFIGVVLALGLVGAGWILGSQIKQTKLGDHYVSVKGLVERIVKSDLAIWSISFRASGDDFKTVLAQGESQKQIVLAFLKKQGVGENEIAINPPTVLDREAQEFGSVQGRQSRYILTQNIVVTSKDVDQSADRRPPSGGSNSSFGARCRRKPALLQVQRPQFHKAGHDYRGH